MIDDVHGPLSWATVTLVEVIVEFSNCRIGSDSFRAAIDNARRVLVVDDHRDSAESLARLLVLYGADVQLAYDGMEAVEAAHAFRPHVILLDLSLPKLNGYDAARLIRRESWGKSITIVALTGWAHENDKRRSKEAGIDVHLVKPVAPELLEKIVATSEPTAV